MQYQDEMLSEKEYAFWLCSLPGVYAGMIWKLLAHFETPGQIYHAKRCQLEQAGIHGKDWIERVLGDKSRKKIQNDYESMEKKGIHFLYCEEGGFPERLRHIPEPPYGIFYKGKLPSEEQPAVAVVGARKATEGGKQIAAKLGYELAANGVQVVSGMALGIDICSQRGAMQWTHGRSFAVLGTGADVCYPRSHLEDYLQIPKYGGIISEFPPGTPPLPYHFPIRNRIISGLSDGVLVIEAKKGSGSLITAECALEQGREIFVVPGAVFDAQYAGGNELLKSGAVLVTEVKDILDGLGIYLDEDIVERRKKTNLMLETTEKMVYSILSLEPVHISELLERSELEIGHLSKVLLSLQKKELVKMTGTGYYMIRLYTR